jgi:hypothetical protein
MPSAYFKKDVFLGKHNFQNIDVLPESLKIVLIFEN